MGEYWCVDCGRHEGEMHKSGCRFDQGENLVDWDEYNQELHEIWLREQQWGHG